jgi:hypothetical protein
MLVELWASSQDRPGRAAAAARLATLLKIPPITNWPKECLTCRTSNRQNASLHLSGKYQSIYQHNINAYHRVFSRPSDAHRLIAPFAQELDHVFLAGILELLELLSLREQWLHERHVSVCQPTLCASGNGILNMPQCIQLGTVSPHCGLSTSTSGRVPASGTAREPAETCVPASRRQTGACAEAAAASCGNTTCARGGSDGNPVCCVLYIAPGIMAMPRHTSLTPS